MWVKMKKSKINNQCQTNHQPPTKKKQHKKKNNILSEKCQKDFNDQFPDYVMFKMNSCNYSYSFFFFNCLQAISITSSLKTSCKQREGLWSDFQSDPEMIA